MTSELDRKSILLLEGAADLAITEGRIQDAAKLTLEAQELYYAAGIKEVKSINDLTSRIMTADLALVGGMN